MVFRLALIPAHPATPASGQPLGPSQRRSRGDSTLTYVGEAPPLTPADVRALRGTWRARTDSVVVELGDEGGLFPDPDYFAWLHDGRFHAEAPVFGVSADELLFVSRFDQPARRFRLERLGAGHIRLTPTGDGGGAGGYGGEMGCGTRRRWGVSLLKLERVGAGAAAGRRQRVLA